MGRAGRRSRKIDESVKLWREILIIKGEICCNMWIYRGR